jgi:hypothetical protein
MSECIDHGCKGMGMGYATAWITVYGVKRSTTLHRKVYYKHTGLLPEVVRHTCDNPRCINPLHLIGGTQLDNVRDMDSRGRRKVGNDYRRGDARGYGTKLTDADVGYIRENWKPRDGTFGTGALATRFNVSPAQISRIAHNLRRVHA